MADWDEDFDAFVVVELPRLLRLGYALTGSQHDARDLAQDTLVAVGLHWRTVRRKGAESAYARTTLVRLNIRRWRSHRHEILSAPADLPAAAVDDAVPGLSPELTAALNALGARQRTTVVLRHIYDMTMRQIAAEMSCSVGTVKSQLSRAEARLRQTLGEPAGATQVAGPEWNGAPDA